MPATPKNRRPSLVRARTLVPAWVPPMNNPVSVVSVTVVSATVLRWTFSAAITAVPVIAPLGSLGGSHNGTAFTSPTAVAQDGVASLLLTYAGETFAAGAWYLVDGAPAGLTFATGALIGSQSGKASNPLGLAGRKAARAVKAKAARASRPATVAGRIGKPARKAA